MSENVASPIYVVTKLRQVPAMHRKIAVGDVVVTKVAPNLPLIVWRTTHARPINIPGHGTNWDMGLTPICDLNGRPVHRDPISVTYGPVTDMWTADVTDADGGHSSC